ncbi:thermonuclease family protein (plasmid) [Mesorhizobium sp. AR10]|uniref:thermonuclease family protein n=1 Tax=Mesorhizobium sp. AR10 TaxID=2865839 RepID=UPI002202C9BB|nr:thermonuclease family protein [Mesorhizobium sp. AR10]UVK35713.1 thermonuclease family protein [Mesorhizobium sp. AR10]
MSLDPRYRRPDRDVGDRIVAADVAAAGEPGPGSHNLSHWIGHSPGPIAGVASVIDGDTIEIRGQRVRLNGIDAPESAQQCNDAKGFRYQCGTKSAAALDTFLTLSRPTHCTFVSWGRYRRYVGDCHRADGKSVAGWLVENGLAVDWPKYGHGNYAEQQAAKVVVWLGVF